VYVSMCVGVGASVQSPYIRASGGQSKPAKRSSDHRVYSTSNLISMKVVPPVCTVLYSCILRLTVSFNKDVWPSDTDKSLRGS
jgi:hypothetical protein